ncbi:hypothetical protein PTSG_00394 [Salpingoeca rosetta]|uniref:Dual specificity phosphatase n=1 Tax=Salpingoeca rosetta (strain ATCC 50818 / BSB-021) TaxID=946362 RepID=F2TWC8_SALR5|nr:uncharacterized protein PTSG_00394 [Salpingoeca rosetta]EGD72374.1 hypothetical protein PTSG_00394 [Salpingoeca rosetta]|eukprot:XP_004998943.1 hypothetical protein PTSG_00394 [Salpingoeca rosetta]
MGCSASKNVAVLASSASRTFDPDGTQPHKAASNDKSSKKNGKNGKTGMASAAHVQPQADGTRCNDSGVPSELEQEDEASPGSTTLHFSLLPQQETPAHSHNNNEKEDLNEQQHEEANGMPLQKEHDQPSCNHNIVQTAEPRPLQLSPVDNTWDAQGATANSTSATSTLEPSPLNTTTTSAHRLLSQASSPGLFVHTRSVDDYHPSAFFPSTLHETDAEDNSSSSTCTEDNDDDNRDGDGDKDDVAQSDGSAAAGDDNSIGSLPMGGLDDDDTLSRPHHHTLHIEDVDIRQDSTRPSPTPDPLSTHTAGTRGRGDGVLTPPLISAARKFSLTNVLHAQLQEQAALMADVVHESDGRTDAKIMQEWDTMRRSIGDRLQLVEEKRRASAHATILLQRKSSVGRRPSPAAPDTRSETLQSVYSAIGNLASDVAGCSELFNALNAGIVRPYVHDAEYMLLIDARDHAAFTAGHIITAQHKDMLNPMIAMSDYSLVIVYDESGSASGPAAAMRDELLSSGVQYVTLLSGGFAKFSKRYPFLSHETQTNVFVSLSQRESLQTYPSEIRVQQIYLGNFLHAHSDVVVKDLGITHILNATKEHENKFPGSVTYCSLRVSDVPSENVMDHFDMAASFIHKAVKGGGRVLVHCTMGVSRSTTFLTAYFMKHKQWTLKHALEFISDRRQGVKPNQSFLKQLSKWEETIFGSKKTDIDLLYI